MAEINKIDLGSIKIHKKVLAEIVSSTVQEIDGITLVGRNFASSLVDLMGFENFPGVCVTVDKSNQVTIEVKVRVHYGMNIPDIARQVQDAIREAVEKTADIDLKDVNVNIQGMERGNA
ncbi:MAG: Asp23/Gls24 family envelope stress response protein [Candidatus Omnitrophica bacterium]|nr:Asp23/Gls24 family envelope stress response protein [Candidatus Omnitrophota bacterium]